MNQNFNKQSPVSLVWIIFIIIIIFVPRLFIPALFFYFILKQTGLIYKIGDFVKDFFKDSSNSLKSKINRVKANAVDTEPSKSTPNYFTPMENMTFKKSYIIYIIIALIGLFIIIDGLVSVPAGHVAVIYDRGRGVLDEAYDEGLHLKIPFWQVAYIMDTRLQSYTMSIAPGEGQKYDNDSIESLSKDGQKVFIDVTLQYRINKNDAPKIFQQVGIDYEQKVIRPGARNIIRDIITGYDSTKLFTQETRTEAQLKMLEQLKTDYAKNNVSLEDVLLRNIQFSEIYLQSIEDKLVAQQKIQKAEFERQEAEKKKETKIIEAQAEAEAIRLKGETLKANPQVIQFEFVQKISPQIKWGILPDNVIPMMDFNNMSQ